MLITLVMQTVLGIGAALIVMGFSRHREYRADEGGAKLEGIARLEAHAQRRPSQRAVAA